MNFEHPYIRRLSTPFFQKSAGIALVLIWMVCGVIAVNRQVNDYSADFREFFLTTRQTVYGEVEAAKELEVPFTYPPFFHVLVAGFSWLPLAPAAGLWYGFCSLLTVAAIYLLSRICREDDRPVPSVFVGVPVLMGLGLILNDLIMGNANLPVLFCMVLCLYLFRSRRDFLAGVALAAGVGLKILPGIFGLYFLYKRRFRVVLGAVAGSAFFFLAAPVITLGPARGSELIGNWVQQMLPLLQPDAPGRPGEADQEQWYENEYIYRSTNQSLLAILHRFLRPIPSVMGQKPMGKVNIANLSPRAVEIIYFTLAAAILAGAAFLLRIPTEPDRKSPALALEYSIVILVMLLLSRITWVNYLVHLLVGYFAAFHYLGKSDPKSRGHRITQFGLILAFVLSLAGSVPMTQALALPMLGAIVLGAAIAYDLRTEYKARARQPSS